MASKKTSPSSTPDAENTPKDKTVIRRPGGRQQNESTPEQPTTTDDGVRVAPSFGPPKDVGVPRKAFVEPAPNEARADSAKNPEKMPELPQQAAKTEEEEDFESLFEATTSQATDFAPGDKVRGRVVAITNDSVFVDLGGKSEGSIPTNEFRDDEGEVSISEGEEIEAWVVEMTHGIELSRTLRGGGDSVAQLEAAYAAGIPIEAKVTGVNKGGLELKVGGKRGFCPISQIDVIYVENTEVYVGRTLRFRIVNFDPSRDLVLSRRALLESEAAEQAEETLKTLAEGAIMTGKVKNVRDFGAFVDLGGVEGLLHVSEISWERIEDAEKVLHAGDQVRVKVMKIDEEGDRISLSMKALQMDPWMESTTRFREGTRFEGRVVRVMDFGVFVELEPGIEGMVHISELAWRRINHPSEVVEEGQTLGVVVTNIDHDRRRIGLSARNAEGDPWSAVEAQFAVGAHVTGTVERAESFGVFLTLAPGITGLLPRSEMEGHAGSDLRRTYPPGRECRVKVVSIEKGSRRISLSETAIQEDEEKAELAHYHKTKGDSGGEVLSDLALALRAALEKKNLEENPTASLTSESANPTD